jgi:MFS family permease
MWKRLVPDWGVRPVAMLVAGTLFMENLDGTIIATAAPSIARSFHVVSAQVGVCVTAYLVTVAALIPVSGWLADRWGARAVLLVAITVFTGASVLCALSTNLIEISVMRVLQGIGGAMMVPVGRLVVLSATDKQHIIQAIAYLTWPALLAPVIAPAVGGLLTTYASWHWIFLINVPLGAVAFIVAMRIMPATPRGHPGKLDWIGFLCTALSLGCLVSSAALLGQPSVPWLPTLALAGVGLGVGWLGGVHLLRASLPLVRLDALRVRTFRSAQGGGSLFRIGINAVPFLLPLLFQDHFGWTPARAGAMVLFLFAGNVAIKPLTTPLLRAIRFRTVLIATTTMAACSIAACMLFRASTPVVLIVAVLLVGGVFRSIGYTCYNTIAFADIEQPQMRQANSLATTIQQLTQAFGVAVGVVSLKVGRQLLGLPHEYSFAFVVLACLILLATLDAIRLPRSAGDSIRLTPVGEG